MQDNAKGKNTVLEGALSLTIATVIVKILGAIYKIPISHVLGEEGMGYFNSAYTVYSFFVLLCTVGVPKAIMLLYADADGDKREESKIISTALTFFIIIGTSLSIVFSLLSIPLSKLIGSPDAYISMVFISPSILFSGISSVFRGHFSAKVKFIHIAVSQIIEGAGKLIFGLILAMLSAHANIALNIVSAFAILGATLGSLGSLLYLIIITKVSKTDKISRQKLKIDEKALIVSRMIKISLPIAMGAMIMSITNIIDLGIVMRRLISLGYSASSATALYGNYTTFATPLFNTAISLFTPITVAFMPSLIKERLDKNRLLDVIKDELDISFFIFAPLSVGLCVYSEEILLLLFDDHGVFLGSRLLVYLILSIFFLIPLTIVNCTLEATGEVKAPMVSMLVGAIFKIVSGYVLIGNTGFGISGAPISTLIFYGVALITSLIIAYKKVNVLMPIVESAFLPLVNSFISIYLFYPLYSFASSKMHWIVAFLIAVILSIILYIAINAFQDNSKFKSYLKKHNAQIQR